MTNNQVYYTNGGGDEQYTPRKTVEILLPYIQHLKDKIIWCLFDKEDSQFIQVLKEDEFLLLIPRRRTKFYNAKTGEVGKQPTFKAAYFTVGVFEKQIILADLER